MNQLTYPTVWATSTILSITLCAALSGCALTDISMAKTRAQHAEQSGNGKYKTNKALSARKSPQIKQDEKATTVAATKTPPTTKAQMNASELVSGEISPKQAMEPLPPVDLSRFYGEPLDKNITHYVRGIMHDLVGNLHYVNDKTPIGVTSFVFLDGNFDGSDTSNDKGLLGNQIAESFIHEVHQFGIPVIDFKTTDYIRVTNNGDFIFSRDYLDLKEEQPIKYVLAGTLVKHRGGMIVNARIIGLLSKAVVASAQAFIPEMIVDGLMSSSGGSGVSLEQSK